MKNLTLIFLLFFVSLNATADIISENEKRVSYHFKVENTQDFEDYMFVAYPVNISNGKPELEFYVIDDLKNYYCSGRFSVPYVYAIETGKFDLKELEKRHDPDNFGQTEDLLQIYLDRVGIKIGEISAVVTVPRFSNYSNINDVYIITDTEGTLSLSLKERNFLNENGEVVKTSDSFDSSFNVLYILVAASFLALVSIVLIIIRKRRVVS